MFAKMGLAIRMPTHYLCHIRTSVDSNTRPQSCRRVFSFGPAGLSIKRTFGVFHEQRET